ncbi:MAG TPA: acetyl-CoA C-acetyltransferase [Pyrinomonadaceae bacterium]|nr:acetyl-CoA C-acetyltransferase [Chloracidobacterium sp.]MBP9936007.1 acetyl-CoA C-acetyltransferase [Pyrinomonadaceae bacterium]MBK7803881.1 acetyl-CoA C-acetyltransferase [Chloracidobacterium sp.]MBK9439447.1 acetyl-CoA C-acetyltransferase [Chloracidobacterium sp.]MBK9768288.1 acetyl-CoA C-acetyltransferase [Chloracidobacterium sp.]
MSNLRQAVIISAVRTPTGKFQGALKGMTAPDLGAVAIKAAVERAGIAPTDVNEVIMGCVVQAGIGQAPARQAALKAGLPPETSALTINMVCGSGLRAVALASQSVQLGDAEYVVAGGMESMSNIPYAMPGAREGYRMGNQTVTDLMVMDGLWCPFENWHMGNTGEVVAEKYDITRGEQDDYAYNSHRKAAEAQAAGKFKDEIVPVEIPQKKGDPVILDFDEPVRPETTAESLGKLRPAFKKDGGTVTAGNAPGVNDGASAVVVTSAENAAKLGIEPLGRVVAWASSGIEPKLIMMAPVQGVLNVLKKASWEMGDVDLFELNEAFSVQALGVMKELGLDLNKVNVNGGAVALGHAIGNSGSRILTTLLYEMKRSGAKRGVAALCLGGGNSVAMAVERD